MAKRKAAGKDHYINTGLKTKRSEKREKSEAGNLAAFIINQIPEGYNVWDDIDINEVHLVQEIVKNCGRWIKYCPQIGWLVYNAEEGRWTEYGAESAVQRLITHFGELLHEGAVETNPGEITFARRILSSAGIGAIKNILKGDVSIAADQKKFDADPDLLNCRGDVYNLRTGEIRAGAPEDLFIKSTLCRAGKIKKTEGGWELPEIPEKFNDFMEKTTSKGGVKRGDLAVWILSYFGYCLTGDNGASFFVNFHGQGKNGKSVLLNLMLKLFGDYAAPLPKDLVIENRFAGQFDLAGLPGIRLGVLIDAPEGRLNMDELKSIISGDEIRGKRKYLEDFKFNPVIKIAVGSNPRLTLKDTGMSVRRRIRMVPFDNIISDEEDISHYHNILLKEEAAQILSLLIWFAHEYYKRGEGVKAFPACKVVDETSAEYMESEDLVGRWKKECTEAVEANDNNYESATDLYNDFIKWCDGEGVRKKMSKNKFGECLTNHIPNKKRKESAVVYLGIKLKTKPQQAGPPLQERGG